MIGRRGDSQAAWNSARCMRRRLPHMSSYIISRSFNDTCRCLAVPLAKRRAHVGSQPRQQCGPSLAMDLGRSSRTVCSSVGVVCSQKTETPIWRSSFIQYGGYGLRIYREIVSRVFGPMGFTSITALLPPSRSRVGVMRRLGFEFEATTSVMGLTFNRYRLRAPVQSLPRVQI